MNNTISTTAKFRISIEGKEINCSYQFYYELTQKDVQAALDGKLEICTVYICIVDDGYLDFRDRNMNLLSLDVDESIIEYTANTPTEKAKLTIPPQPYPIGSIRAYFLRGNKEIDAKCIEVKLAGQC